MKNSIKREQSQACLNFAERKNFRLQAKYKILMTLALLLTAVTGAWAQSYEAKVFDVPASWAQDETNISAADLPKDFVQITKDEAKALAVPDGPVLLVYGFVGENVLFMPFENGTAMPDDEDDDGAPESRGQFIVFQTVVKATVCYTAASGPTVAWDASTKTGTFSMPGSDVVLTPIYAKAAAFATTGTGSEVKTLLPEAAEGVIADTDAPLIKEGTGIVAFAGESTTVTQGTLMYAVTPATITEAPALDAENKWSADVPTAKTVADGGIDVLVWYYIQGADAPEGEAATLDNTFNDTEPACLTVQVLSNKFDIQFNAANANTIEAGKATVTVAGAAATVTDGKLQGVKMGTEVKLEAKPGYKFRKVEVKKAASAPSLNITSPAVGQVIGSDGKNYAYGSLPTGVTAVAKICYVNEGHGLALALADEGTKDWSTAQTTCAAHTPAFTGGTWKLASLDEWNNMITAAGSHTDLRDGFSSVGGTNMQLGSYWSSTEDGSSSAWYYLFLESIGWSNSDKEDYFCVRACLAF